MLRDFSLNLICFFMDLDKQLQQKKYYRALLMAQNKTI